MDKYQQIVFNAAMLAAYNGDHGVDAVRKYSGGKIDAGYPDSYIKDLLARWGL